MKKYVNNSFITKSPSEYKNGTAAVTNLPVTIYTDGQPVSSYTLKGNTSVSGTPSPQNPITISGVGEETANLLNTNQSAWEQGGIASSDGQDTESTIRLRTKDYYAIENLKYYHISITNTNFCCNNMLIYNAQKQYIGNYVSSVNPDFNGATSMTLYIPNNNLPNAAFFRLVLRRVDNDTIIAQDITDIKPMLNLSGNELPFEPYGYKISILKDSQPLTPIYVSQQLFKIGDTTDDYSSSGTATYNVAKYEFTGTERVQKNYSEDPTSYLYYTSMTLAADEVICTQLPYGAAIPKTDIGITGRANNNILYLNFGADIMNAQTSGNTANGLKEYLAAQYAAGTPVTVYYVIATPTTETVTAPSIPTTGGEVSIDVDTTIKPSELDLTYHGWHEHQPLKRENGQWV